MKKNKDKLIFCLDIPLHFVCVRSNKTYNKYFL